MKLTAFLGTWINSENEYQFGQPPKDAIYIISQLSETQLQFDMSWLDANDQQQTLRYTSIVDGQKYAYEPNTVVDQVQTTQVKDTIMESRSFKAKSVVGFASRELLNDGMTMKIIQQTIQADGSCFTNISWYQKQK